VTIAAVLFAKITTPPAGARVLLVRTRLVERHDEPTPAITVFVDIPDAVTADALGDAHLLLQTEVGAALLASGTQLVTARCAQRRRQACAAKRRYREAE
jgi:hypothetical protein